MSSLVDVGSLDYVENLELDLERRREGSSLVEEGDALSQSLRAYVRAAWHVVLPDEQFIDNWHIGAICEQLEEVSTGRCKRLMIWVPPGSMKTICTSVMWPTWEWTTRPHLRYMTGSYDLEIQIEQGAIPARALIQSPWYEDRWGHVYRLREDQNKRAAYLTDHGGARFVVAPNAKKATGRHVHRLILDDPNDPESSDMEMKMVSDWHDAKLTTRLLPGGAKVVIQQRLHDKDLSGHLNERDEWTVLCLPERYDPKHQFAWPDDPREEGELLWPKRYGESEHKDRRKGMGIHRASGQLQQEPTSPEGDLLKTADWRFYDPRIRAREEWHKLPSFGMVVVSVDTPLKDAEANDLVAIQCYGVARADRYLLDLDKGHMNYSKCKRRVLEIARYARRTFPQCAHYLLIENGGYGADLIVDLKREITGVQKISPSGMGDKVMRATAASSDLESNNIFLPGYGPPWQDYYDEALTPADVADFVANCARFPKCTFKDDIDAWSQAINWLRGRSSLPLRTSSALKRLAGTRR